MFPGFASVNEEESVSTIIKAALQSVRFTPVFVSVFLVPLVLGFSLLIFSKNVYISSILFFIMSICLLFTQNVNNFMISRFPNETFDQKAFIIFLFWAFPILCFLSIFLIYTFIKTVKSFFSEIQINITFFKKSKTPEEH